MRFAPLVVLATLFSAASFAESPGLTELKQQQERLTLENSITEQNLRKELARITAEKQRLEAEAGLAQQKKAAENAAQQAEIERLTKQSELIAKRLALKEAERREKLEIELAATREKMERLKAANELASLELVAKTRDLQQRDQELMVRSKELQIERSDFEMQLAKLNAEIDLREKRDLWRNRVNREITYTKEPFKDGMLTISDRRIPLNGVVTMEMADFIQERIDYFNNQTQDFPIFIVIDASPGGSVMAGYKILKSMEGSPAPVYVVVKSFAASMAAGITTMAKRSFAYPNAIILHHQILSFGMGNLTQQKEQLEELEEWWRRLAEPVAKKMGITVDEFIKRMYANRSTGDWKEFADAAKKLRWVDEVVDNVREQSFVKNPDTNPAPKSRSGGLAEQTDAQGRRFVLLPRLSPLDCYYLYNPDSFYRLTP